MHDLYFPGKVTGFEKGTGYCVQFDDYKENDLPETHTIKFDNLLHVEEYKAKASCVLGIQEQGRAKRLRLGDPKPVPNPTSERSNSENAKLQKRRTKRLAAGNVYKPKTPKPLVSENQKTIVVRGAGRESVNGTYVLLDDEDPDYVARPLYKQQDGDHVIRYDERGWDPELEIVGAWLIQYDKSDRDILYCAPS